MRNVYRLLLMAVMAIAAMALAAPTAFGQAENHESLEIRDEETQEHCPAVVRSPHGITGGCLIHANSEGGVELRKHVFGIESHITSCTNEFWGRLNEDAEGAIIHQDLTGASCARQACHENGEPEETPWPAHADEGHTTVAPKEGETGVPPGEWMTVTFCVEPIGGGTDESCEIEVPFVHIGSHQYEFGQAAELPGHGVGGFRCELVGHWLTEADHSNQWLEDDPTKQAENEVTVTHIPQENRVEDPQ